MILHRLQFKENFLPGIFLNTGAKSGTRHGHGPQGAYILLKEAGDYMIF